MRRSADRPSVGWMIGLLRELWRLPDPRDEAERGWDLDARGETALQRLDRNWSVLMQEMRVLQTLSLIHI